MVSGEIGAVKQNNYESQKNYEPRVNNFMNDNKNTASSNFSKASKI